MRNLKQIYVPSMISELGISLHICSLYLTDYLHVKAARLTIRSIEKTGRHKRGLTSVRQTKRPSSEVPVMLIDIGIGVANIHSATKWSVVDERRCVKRAHLSPSDI